MNLRFHWSAKRRFFGRSGGVGETAVVKEAALLTFVGKSNEIPGLRLTPTLIGIEGEAIGVFFMADALRIRRSSDFRQSLRQCL